MSEARVAAGSVNPDEKLRADEQEHHMRRRLKARRHNKTSKPCDLTTTVNDAGWRLETSGYLISAVV